MFTYYLKDALKPAAEARREEEKKLVKDGKPVTFPGWDALRKEEQELKPEIVLTVADETGRWCAASRGRRAKACTASRGTCAIPPSIRRSWNRRRASRGTTRPQGPLVVPGTFTVTLAKKLDGVLTPLGSPKSFVVESLTLATLPEKDKAALLAYQKKAGELQRAMMGTAAAAEEALKSLSYMRKALLDTPKADPKLMEQARAIESRHPGGDAGTGGRFDRRPAERGETALADGQGQHPDRLDRAGHEDGAARLRDRGRRLRRGARAAARAHRPGPPQSGRGDGNRRRALDPRPRPARVEEVTTRSPSARRVP